VVVLGPTGRNFAAGMSGGVAFVLDDAEGFRRWHCNREAVDLDPLTGEDEALLVELSSSSMLRPYGKSPGQCGCPTHWATRKPQFVKVMPKEYKRGPGPAGPEEKEKG
jgi:glutamate synthase domain-containing protein 3